MSYTHISTQTIGAGGIASIDFSSITQVYSDLLLVLSLRDNFANISNDATLAVNGTTITFRQLYGTGVNAGSNTVAGLARPIVSSTAAANNFGNTSIYFPNYSSTTTTKTISVDSVVENNATECYQIFSAGFYNSTAAITSLSFDNGASTFSQYSSASLYGINRIPVASAGVTPTVDALVVAGGGGGNTAGGGAGGLQVFSGTAVSSGSAITVTVGAGGAGNYGTGVTGSNGSNSQFAALTASVGGGGGAGFSNSSVNNGNSGGSGGGAGGSDGGYSGTPGSGTAGQGYAGGYAVGQATNQGRGGGGGAGAVGGNGSGSISGAGGIGAVNTFRGSTQYYAGGGGGGANGGTIGLGGNGGGGNGGNQVTGSAGWAGSGGGGGGGLTNSGATGAAGGSGVVVIRYPDKYNAPTAVAGNPTLTYVNGYRVYTWTASGSITF